MHLVQKKTETFLLMAQENISATDFDADEYKVSPDITTKYLGCLLDSKDKFAAHINHVTTKAEITVRRLAVLMSKIGGPKQPKRKLHRNMANKT